MFTVFLTEWEKQRQVLNNFTISSLTQTSFLHWPAGGLRPQFAYQNNSEGMKGLRSTISFISYTFLIFRDKPGHFKELSFPFQRLSSTSSLCSRVGAWKTSLARKIKHTMAKYGLPSCDGETKTSFAKNKCLTTGQWVKQSQSSDLVFTLTVECLASGTELCHIASFLWSNVLPPHTIIYSEPHQTFCTFTETISIIFFHIRHPWHGIIGR